MPIFDYVCDRCRGKFEYIVRAVDARVQCPHCGGDQVTRNTVSLFSCTGVQLTKRLKMESEDRMRKGQEMLKREKLRKERIKIL